MTAWRNETVMMFQIIRHAPPTNIAEAMIQTLLVTAGAPVKRTIPTTVSVRRVGSPESCFEAFVDECDGDTAGGCGEDEQPELQLAESEYRIGAHRVEHEHGSGRGDGEVGHADHHRHGPQCRVGHEEPDAFGDVGSDGRRRGGAFRSECPAQCPERTDREYPQGGRGPERCGNRKPSEQPGEWRADELLRAELDRAETTIGPPQLLALDEVGKDRLVRGVVEDLGDAGPEGDDVEQGDRPAPGVEYHGEHRDERAANDVGDDHGVPPVDTIGERPDREREQQPRKAPNEFEPGDHGGRSCERDRSEG